MLGHKMHCFKIILSTLFSFLSFFEIYKFQNKHLIQALININVNRYIWLNIFKNRTSVPPFFYFFFRGSNLGISKVWMSQKNHTTTYYLRVVVWLWPTVIFIYHTGWLFFLSSSEDEESADKFTESLTERRKTNGFAS